METENSSLDCLICLDLMCEPVTIFCGHSFCRFCLISYLKENMKCPACRKVVVNTLDTLNKNILLADLARAKNPSAYDEKRRQHLIFLNEFRAGDSDVSCLWIHLENTYVIPGSFKEISVDDPFKIRSLKNSFQHQHPVAIAAGENDTILSMVKIESYHEVQNDSYYKAIIVLQGLRRFELQRRREVVNEVYEERAESNPPPIYVCIGRVIQDSIVVDQDYKNNASLEDELIKQEAIQSIKREIVQKAKYIIRILNYILQTTSMLLLDHINSKLNSFKNKSKLLNPTISESMISASDLVFIDHFEEFAFLIISSIKLTNQDREQAFKSLNLYRKIDNLYKIFESLEKDNLLSNPSLAIMFFDLGYESKTVNNSKFCIFLVLLFITMVLMIRLGATKYFKD